MQKDVSAANNSDEFAFRRASGEVNSKEAASAIYARIGPLPLVPDCAPSAHQLITEILFPISTGDFSSSLSICRLFLL